MPGKIAKALALFLMIITAYSEGGLSIVAKEKNEPKTKIIKASNTILKQLSNNSNWKSLSEYWKKLNSIEEGDREKTRRMLESAENGKSKAIANIANLEKSGTLTKEEADFIKSTLEQRLSYLPYSMGTVKCYDMSAMGFKIVEKREDLEQRYDVMQKLYTENKINSETYNKTRAKILEDMNFIEENDYNKKSNYVKNNLLELIILLNK